MALTITHPKEHVRFQTTALEKKLFEVLSDLPMDVVIQPDAHDPDRYLVLEKGSDGLDKVSTDLPALDAIAFEEYTGFNPALDNALERLAEDIRSDNLWYRTSIADEDYERIVSAFNPMGANYPQ